MILSAPRLVIAGLSGDGGKTLVALGLARAFAQRAASVAAFKKGPDYIDAAWLGFAAGTAGRNLDTFLMDDEALGTALSRSLPADLLVVEGNRGLFDGLDAAGSHSTATLAKRLRAPVILVVDVTKRTRTTAALVLGCVALDPEVRIAGVVLNRVATERQERVIREAIERAGLPPVVGAIPRLAGKDPLPGRHLGLVTAVVDFMVHPSGFGFLSTSPSNIWRGGSGILPSASTTPRTWKRFARPVPRWSRSRRGTIPGCRRSTPSTSEAGSRRSMPRRFRRTPNSGPAWRTRSGAGFRSTPSAEV